jgi:hypothetical protein
LSAQSRSNGHVHHTTLGRVVYDRATHHFSDRDVRRVFGAVLREADDETVVSNLAASVVSDWLIHLASDQSLFLTDKAGIVATVLGTSILASLPTFAQDFMKDLLPLLQAILQDWIKRKIGQAVSEEGGLLIPIFLP